jgi:NTP pyrophosphatase (non-canonical NTP hydrolase)
VCELSVSDAVNVAMLADRAGEILDAVRGLLALAKTATEDGAKTLGEKLTMQEA